MIIDYIQLIFKYQEFSNYRRKVGAWMIVFDRLWDKLKENDISQYKLINTYHISPSQLTRLKRNNNINTHTINTFCEILHCKVEDIMEYVED